MDYKWSDRRKMEETVKKWNKNLEKIYETAIESEDLKIAMKKFKKPVL